MIEARVIADSISPQGDRLTTFILTFPRIILAEFNTHRMFSRNSASSRAIPFEKMVKSVLNSFWLAIYNKKLEVSVEEILITKDTLDFLMEQYFPEDLTDRSNDQNSELANPKSYYYSVRYFDPKRKDSEFKMFDEQLKNLGRCQLFVYRKDGLSNKTMHVRSPNMLIYKKLNQNISVASSFY